MLNRPILFLAAAALLSGCLAGRDVAERNRAGIDRLAVSMTREHVHTLMGTRPEDPDLPSHDRDRHPFRTETYPVDGRTWEVLFYQTGRVPTGEDVEEEDLTPVVLLDGLLVGWGWDFWRDTAAESGITISGS